MSSEVEHRGALCWHSEYDCSIVAADLTRLTGTRMTQRSRPVNGRFPARVAWGRKWISSRVQNDPQPRHVLAPPGETNCVQEVPPSRQCQPDAVLWQ